MRDATRSLWWNRRAIGLHITVALTVPGFFALGWWQLHRALGGNELSWAYTFEWPFFAGYATYLWWRLVHESPLDEPQPASTQGHLHIGRRRRRNATSPGKAAREQEALAAYNAYLSSLRRGDEYETD